MTDDRLGYEDATVDGLTYTPHAKYPELLIRRCGNIVQAQYKTGVGPQTAKALWLNPEFYSDPRFDFDDRWKMTHLTMQCASGLSVRLLLCFESIFDRTRYIKVDMDFKNPDPEEAARYAAAFMDRENERRRQLGIGSMDPEARRQGLNKWSSEEFMRNKEKETEMQNAADPQSQTLALMEFTIGNKEPLDRVALVQGHVGAREFRRAMHARYPDWDPNDFRYEYAIFRDDESLVCNVRPDETDAKPVTIAYGCDEVEQL